MRGRANNELFTYKIAFVDALPMTVTGKVIRKALKARAATELEEI